MTVFVTHAGPDLEAAEALEGALERRGHFVERDDGEAALAPLTAGDTVVLLISQAFAEDTNRLRLTHRALEGWCAQRLVLVALDEAQAPVGLRDLPIVDARSLQAREQAWAGVASALQKSVREAEPASPNSTKMTPLSVLAHIGLAIPGLAALALLASIWLANRIGPRPGGIGDLLIGLDAFGRQTGLPAGAAAILTGLALVLLVAAVVRFRLRVLRPGGDRARPAGEPIQTGGLYLSFTPGDRAKAEALIEAARAAGVAPPSAVKLDLADACAVFCSPEAYASDLVRRDVFLADRNGKALIPLMLEAASPPDDFAFYLPAGKGVRLFEAEPDHQGALVAEALRAAFGAPRTSQARE